MRDAASAPHEAARAAEIGDDQLGSHTATSTMQGCMTQAHAPFMLLLRLRADAMYCIDG